MARTGLSVLGAVVGGVIGTFIPGIGTILGAQLGFVGGGIAGSLAFPQQGPTITGPRLGDLDIQSSAFGIPVAVVFGTSRLAGNVIWATQIKETKIETEQGGGGGGKGGGGGGTTTVSFLYSVDMAISMCEGPIAGIRRIWGDTKLLYDVSDTASFDTQAASLISLGENGSLGTMTIYLGSQTQEPDPLIEADKGAGQVPAHRGLAYVVFDDFQLRNFGNRIPNLSFEVVFSGSETFSELGNVAVPDSDSTTYFTLMAPHLDANGEMIILYNRGTVAASPNNSYLSPKFKVMRSVGTTLVNVPKVPAPFPGNFSDTTRSHDTGFKFKMDHPGYVIWDFSADQTMMFHWDTQTTTLFDPLSDFFAMEQRGGDAIFLRGSQVKHFTSGGSFVGTSGTLTAPVDVGISDNWFWVLTQASGGQILRINKTTLATDTTFALTGVTASALANIDVHSDTLMFIVQQTAAATIKVFKVEISGSTATVTDITGNVTVTATDANEALDKPFHVKGSLIIWGGRGPGITAAQLSFIGGNLSSNAVALSTVVSNLCVKAGLKTTEIDVTALASDNVSGYAIGREVTARQAIEPLQIAFNFDAVESDAKIKFVKRGGSSIESIPETALAAREPGTEIPDLVTTKRINEKELPRVIDIGYANNGNSHQAGVQRATRLITKSDVVSSVQLPISMTDDDARQIADKLLYQAWLIRHSRQIQVSRRYLFLDPTDIIMVTAGSAIFILRIIESSFGEPGVLTLRCLDDAAAVFSSTATGGVSDPVETPPGLVGSTRIVLLDLPLLRDQEDSPGFYAAARGFTTTWPGCVLFRSIDDGASFTEMKPILNETPIGEAVTVLASGPFTIFDEVNTVTIRLTGGVLASDTEINVLNGANACALGAEIFQFKTATLNGEGDYVLSGLLRARRGTEQHLGTHAVADCFVLLQSSSVENVPNSLAEIGNARTFKAPTIGLTLEAADSIAFTDNGIRLEPLSPVHITAVRDVPATDDITFSWIRRGRIGPEWRDLVDLPLGETTESYEVDIFDNGTVLRTLTSTTQTVVYTAAQQTTDFGSPQASVHVKVYQLSADVGRGFPGDATV